MARNKADQARMDAIHAMPCQCCEILGLAHEQPFKTDAHHLVDKGTREHSGGDQASLPICAWHHQGYCLDGWTSSMMLAKYGPSMKYQGGKGKFVERFGTDRERLAIIDARLKPSA